MTSPSRFIHLAESVLHRHEFVSRHRGDETAFTRKRKLSFQAVAVLLLTKTVKGCQQALNEAVRKLTEVESVSAAAFAKARAKFRHTAFIELNEVCVLPCIYDGDEKLFAGMRVLAIDGSKIMLPQNPSTEGAFGVVVDRNPKAQGTHCEAVASCLYDVLNHVCIQAFFEPAKASETALAVDHTYKMSQGDLILLDRGYTSRRLLVAIKSAGADFVVRCTRIGLSGARKLFETPDVWDLTEEVKIDGERIKVRFVKVILDTGEPEVLMTSLLDNEAFQAPDFKDIYWMRWGIETFFGVLKTRLELENFTATSAEAVKQEFFATIFLTGMETIMTAPANEELAQRDTKFDQRVNRAVSFNAIKDHAFELLMSGNASEQDIEALTQLFLQKPTQIRPSRNPKRRRQSDNQKLRWQRFRRKHVY